MRYMEFIYRHRKIICTIVVLVALAFILPHVWGLTVSDILEFTPQSLPLAALVILGLFCLKSFVMVIPAVVLYMAAGMIFPTGWAILLVYASLFVEMSIGYVIGRRIGSARVQKLIQKRPRIARFFERYQSHLQGLCFTARVLPLQFDLSSMFLGAMKLPYPRYVILSLLGATPAMIPYVLAGSAIDDPLSVEFLLPFAISICITLVLFFLFQRYTGGSDSDKKP